MFLFYSVAASTPMVVALVYLNEHFSGDLNFITILNDIDSLGRNEKLFL